ncbi:MAG: protein-L-isoaspartate O-methyltransferase [Nanoarchaeota archaeon]
MNKTELLDFLRKKGFSDKIISAFEKIKRELFIPEHTFLYAYDDMAIPLEPGTTLSQPSTIAFMLTLLNPQDGQKILEIGSGTGYLLSLISELCPKSEIYGLEINRKFAVSSRKILGENNKVHIINRNGNNGLPEKAEFDRIIISAALKTKPHKFLSQLSENGILVAPVGNDILCIEKQGNLFKEQSFAGFSFVPLIEDE